MSVPSKGPYSLPYHLFFFDTQHLQGVPLTALPPNLLNSLQHGSHSLKMNIPSFKMETIILPGKVIFHVCPDISVSDFSTIGPQFS